MPPRKKKAAREKWKDITQECQFQNKETALSMFLEEEKKRLDTAQKEKTARLEEEKRAEEKRKKEIVQRKIESQMEEEKEKWTKELQKKSPTLVETMNRQHWEAKVRRKKQYAHEERTESKTGMMALEKRLLHIRIQQENRT